MGVATLSDLVLWIRDHSAGRPELLSIERGGRRETLSTSEFLTQIHSLALALEARGVEKGDRIAIFSENRPEWHVVDFACHLLGAVSVPIYPTLGRDQVGYLLRNSGTSWVFYSNPGKRDMLTELLPSLTRSPVLVAIDDDARSPQGDSLVRLQGEGAEPAGASPLDKLAGRVQPEDSASIIYTSGTTGEPKGVVLTHGNFVSNFLACSDLFPVGPEDLALSFLPLSHVFERTVDHFFFYKGVAIHYSPSIERVPGLLGKVRPTVMTSVPRLYERAFLKVTSGLAKETPRKQKLFAWALRVGQRHAGAGRLMRPGLSAQRAIADRLVYSRIKERFGGRLRFAIAGGAPLGDQVAEFFDAIGLPLYQGYGMTEASPVISANAPGRNRRGSVGQAIQGVEVRLAEDGEILVRGPGVMRGYWDDPEATAETIDPEGWLKTGDIGTMDQDGYLFITDRKKDLLVTSGGKNVAPQPIEQLLTAHWSIAQALVAGDNYPYLTALLVPRFEELPEELREIEPKKLVRHPKMLEIVKEAVGGINRRLSEHERIRRWTLLDHELSEEAGEITPTLKLRRRVVLERYGDLVDSMYLKTQKVG